MRRVFLQTKTGMGELMNNAIFSMVEAKFAMGDFNQMILNSIEKAQVKATAKKDNVAGIFCMSSSHGVDFLFHIAALSFCFATCGR